MANEAVACALSTGSGICFAHSTALSGASAAQAATAREIKSFLDSLNGISEVRARTDTGSESALSETMAAKAVVRSVGSGISRDQERASEKLYLAQMPATRS